MTSTQPTGPTPERLPSGEQPQPQAAPRVPALRAPSDSRVRRRRARRVWLWAAAVAAALAGGAALYLRPWAAGPALVAVEPAALAPVTRVLAVNGRVAALNSVDLRPLVPGTIAEVLVAEGDAVASGQILARIESSAQQAVVRQSVAALDAALVAQEQADATYARSLALGSNISAAALEADRRAAQSAMQEVARMTALLDQAQIQLQRHTLRAPVPGTLVTMDARVGQIVDSATVLMTLADLDGLVVEVDVDETHAGQIALGQTAALRLAGETETRAGRVRSVARQVDAGTGGLTVKIAFDGPVRAPIGLTVAANIVVDQRAAALTVPRSALVTDHGGTAVFVMRGDTATLQPIRVIDWPAERLIVTEGLTQGDPVIVDAMGLAAGQKIRLQAN